MRIEAGTTSTGANPPLVELRSISKGFPGVAALRNVTVTVGRGEVVGLIGENGAGKSTLMRILGGVYEPDVGEIFIDGKSLKVDNVAHAMRLGIAFIHQELNLLDNIDVAGNIWLGREPTMGGFLKLIDRTRMAVESRKYLDHLGLNLPPSTLVGRLGLAQRQMVEVAKALSQEARLIIMDEPTSSLTAAETDRLLTAVEDLRSHGVSVIYISHRLGEIERIADRVVALKDGQNSGTLAREEINHAAMVRLMVGRDIKGLGEPPIVAAVPTPALELRQVHTQYRPDVPVNFIVREGEILGMAGLVGAGRSELAQAIFGVEPAVSGEIILKGKPIRIRQAQDAISAGIYLIPEDRRHTGLITEMSVKHNITLAGLDRCARLGLISRTAELEWAQTHSTRLGVKVHSLDAAARQLSGGNQQKVVLAKWLSLNPKVLICDEPTRGIDVGAKAEIYLLLRKLALEGVAVVMISSDMEEVIGVSDRIAVMHEGRIAGIVERGNYSEEAVMRLALGRNLQESGT